MDESQTQSTAELQIGHGKRFGLTVRFYICDARAARFSACASASFVLFNCLVSYAYAAIRVEQDQADQGICPANRRCRRQHRRHPHSRQGRGAHCLPIFLIDSPPFSPHRTASATLTSATSATSRSTTRHSPSTFSRATPPSTSRSRPIIRTRSATRTRRRFFSAKRTRRRWRTDDVSAMLCKAAAMLCIDKTLTLFNTSAQYVDIFEREKWTKMGKKVAKRSKKGQNSVKKVKKEKIVAKKFIKIATQ